MSTPPPTPAAPAVPGPAGSSGCRSKPSDLTMHRAQRENSVGAQSPTESNFASVENRAQRENSISAQSPTEPTFAPIEILATPKPPNSPMHSTQRDNNFSVQSPTASTFPSMESVAPPPTTPKPLPLRVKANPQEALKSLKRKRAAEKLEPIFTRLRFKLAPIHAVPDGAAHPQYPETLLHYHTLTEEQLDSMARWYHQWTDEPCVWTELYPGWMDWDQEFLVHLGEKHGCVARARAKRRKFGKFIGLLGCETPVEELDVKNEWLRAKNRNRIKTASDMLSYRSHKRY